MHENFVHRLFLPYAVTSGIGASNATCLETLKPLKSHFIFSKNPNLLLQHFFTPSSLIALGTL